MLTQKPALRTAGAPIHRANGGSQDDYEKHHATRHKQQKATDFTCLFISITRDLTSCRTYEVNPATCKAGNRLIFVFRHFFGGKALDVVAGLGAAI